MLRISLMLITLVLMACNQPKCKKGSFKVDENGMRFGYCSGRHWREYDLVIEKDTLKIKWRESSFSKDKPINVAILTQGGQFAYYGTLQVSSLTVEVDSKTQQINESDYLVQLRILDNNNLVVADSITMIVSKELGLRYYSESGDACYRAFL
jgi:hypothetical protein